MWQSASLLWQTEKKSFQYWNYMRNVRFIAITDMRQRRNFCWLHEFLCRSMAWIFLSLDERDITSYGFLSPTHGNTFNFYRDVSLTSLMCDAKVFSWNMSHIMACWFMRLKIARSKSKITFHVVTGYEENVLSKSISQPSSSHIDWIID